MSDSRGFPKNRHRKSNAQLVKEVDSLKRRIAELESAAVERESVEQALRESEARLVEVARIARIGHSIWDERENREVYSSEEGDRIWGELDGKLWDFDEFLASVHPDDRARVEAVMEQARENRTGYEIEYKIVRPDGEMRFILERADAELDDAGELLNTVTTVQDITEGKRTEAALRQARDELELRVEERTADLRTTNQALVDEIAERKRMEYAVRETEARLSAIVDHAPNAISLKDRRGHYLLINHVFEKMLDTTSEEVRGKTSPEIFPREFAESGVAHDRAVVEKGCAIEREEELVLGDHAYTFLTTKFPIRDASGDIVSIGAIHTDVTERKRAEEALRKSEERYRTLFDLAPICIYVEDYSSVKRLIDGLKAQGVDDLRHYFRENPDVVFNAVDSIDVIDVNQRALELHRAPSKEAYIEDDNDVDSWWTQAWTDLYAAD